MIRYATFGRRTWAVVLDIAIDLFVLGVLRIVVGDGSIAAPFGFWYLLHHVGLVTEGGSLGHRLVGLRVVSTEGARVGAPHAFVRELARLFLSLPPLGMGFLWMLDQRDRRCWHDVIAGTVVVRETTGDAVDAPEWAAAPPWRQPKAMSESK